MTVWVIVTEFPGNGFPEASASNQSTAITAKSFVPFRRGTEIENVPEDTRYHWPRTFTDEPGSTVPETANVSEVVNRRSGGVTANVGARSLVVSFVARSRRPWKGWIRKPVITGAVRSSRTAAGTTTTPGAFGSPRRTAPP